MYSDLSQAEVTVIHLVWQVRVEGRGLKVKSPSLKTCVNCNGCWQRGLIKMTAHIHMHSFVCSAWRSLPRRLNKREEGSQGLWRMPGGVWSDNTHILKHTQWPSSLRPVVSQVWSYCSDSWASTLCMGSFSSQQPTPPHHTHTRTHKHRMLHPVYCLQFTVTGQLGRALQCDHRDYSWLFIR